MLLDSHCHLDHYTKPFEVIKQAGERGVFIVAMTNLPSHFQQGADHLNDQKNIRHALGMHPLLAAEHANEFSLFEQLVKQTSWIGEIGLDGSQKNKGGMSEQLASLSRIMEIAGPNKAYSLHCRRSEAEVLSMLKEFEVRNAIFHWYSGSKKVLREIVDCGFYLSVNPKMCTTKSGKMLISEIPSSQLLTESDGPFLTHGKTPFYPWDVLKVIEYLCKEKNMTDKEVTNVIWSNFMRICKSLTKNI